MHPLQPCDRAIAAHVTPERHSDSRLTTRSRDRLNRASIQPEQLPTGHAGVVRERDVDGERRLVMVEANPRAGCRARLKAMVSAGGKQSTAVRGRQGGSVFEAARGYSLGSTCVQR